jgi:hypothetical protein
MRLRRFMADAAEGTLPRYRYESYLRILEDLP